MPQQPWTGPTDCQSLWISTNTSEFCDLIPLEGDVLGATLAMVKLSAD